MRIDEAKAVIEKAKATAAAKRAVIEASKAAARGRGRPRRIFITEEIVRIAVLGGEGKSAGEIAGEIGETNKARIGAILSKHKIRLMQKRTDETAIRLTVQKAALAKISAFALARDTTIEIVMAAALQSLAGEPVILANLLDEDA